MAGAINLLVQSHPINSALSLIVVMASLAAEYLLLGAEFVAAVQVIVYAGAIMVLFLIHHHAAQCRQRRADQGQPRGDAAGRSRTGDRRSAGRLDPDPSLRHGIGSIGALPGEPKDIARLLFHDFLLPFEVTSVLILIAIMGAVVLASRPKQSPGLITALPSRKRGAELVAAGKDH